MLCARIAGDRERSAALRAAAGAAAVPLGMGCYLSFSRGALAALAAGLIALVVLVAAPERAGSCAPARSCVGAGAAGALAAGLARRSARAPARSATREREGAIVLAVAVVLMARRGARRPRCRCPIAPLALPPWSGWAAAGGDRRPARGPDRRRRRASAGAAGHRRRPTSASAPWAPTATPTGAWRSTPAPTTRSRAWAPAASASSGCAGADIDEVVRDAHSLELETFAELGLVGVALLAALLGGVGLSARAAHRLDPALAAGPAAALTAWAFHSAIDWDWEMPALTLVAVVLAGALLARRGRQSSSAIRGASRLKIHTASTQVATKSAIGTSRRTNPRPPRPALGAPGRSSTCAPARTAASAG